MNITKANVKDLPKLLDIQKEAYLTEADTYSDYAIPPLTETLIDFTRALSRSVVLKVELEGVPVASVRATLQGEICEIGRLSVSPHYQHRGIGRSLLLACETLFPSSRYCELFTGSRSEANLRLYESLGYRRIRTHVLSRKVTLIYLRKALP
ncbi:acetyltransferase (GNAT) family protein [Raoultella sp. BIGb0138]|uniref:GNAT family N-acetyltransferase n=1 Tax=Raoultella sp. BIGb0138 TaxID=2485115 RepID=UPI001053D5E9|nr:GNAT family N-acetyltransferase [Raoultella sp. BIGb0138]TCW07822.1 acetyltransferase (GNAT) family protein [Raoultella sp. BIGb0138]